MDELFTVEEINLMCIFDTSSREKLIAELTAALADFEDAEMREIAEGALRKLSEMSDTDYSPLDLYPEYEEVDT
jgi:hypothetical protein